MIETARFWSGQLKKALKSKTTKMWMTAILFAAVLPSVQADDLSITFCQADKLLYKPNEQGSLSIKILNKGKHTVAARVEVTLIQELADVKPLEPRQVQLNRGETRVEIPFAATGRFGFEARVRVKADGATLSASDYFSVTNNFFEVGIGSTWGAALHTGLGKHRDVPAKARKIYSNWFELFFWAPCDWSQLVSPLERWWSGQADYPESETNLLELIQNSHRQGIRVAAYASCNPAGPFAWEVARRRPEMFRRNGYGALEGIYNVEHLDLWNDPKWRQQPRETGWYLLKLDLRRHDALDWGIDQIIASTQHYGWDAIRFDGHYTVAGHDEISTRNMRRLKERVASAAPDLRLGFNYGRAPEWYGGVTHEMREAMAGGGLYLQEGIRNWRYTNQQYENWSHYASNELRVAKQVQSLGGSYHCILSTETLPPPKALYKLVYTLIAGGHPFYGEHAKVEGCSNWGAFLTRWSAMIWDLRLQTLNAPDDRISVSGEPRLHWKNLVQERIESAKRKFIVMHLVNPPENDSISETAYPAPTSSIQVVFRPLAGERVVRASLIQPETEAFQTTLALVHQHDELHVTIPQIQRWGMVIFEVEGTFKLPAEVAQFTETPDQDKVKEAMRAVIARSSADPNQQVATDVPANTEFWETNSGFTGHGIKSIVADPDAGDGLAQNRAVPASANAPSTPFLGRPYMGPLPAGRYRVAVRLKRTAADADGPGQIRFRVSDHRLDKDVAVTHIQTEGYPSPQVQGNLTFARPGVYSTYSLEIELKQAAMIQVSLWPVGKQVESTFVLDRIEIETLEAYSDQKLAEWNPIAKPSDLRIPEGSSPRRGLFVRGMFWQQYRLTKTGWEDAYEIPAKYDAIYPFDVIALSNIDVRQTSHETRYALRDWVEDGGRLIVLGGMNTLGQGGMKSTYFEDLLPFVLRGSGEVIRCEPPLVFGSKPSEPWPENPLLFWRHELHVRDGSEVLVYAGSFPILARRDAGRGQVFAFAGTVMGEPKPEERPFWETKTWQGTWRKVSGLPAE